MSMEVANTILDQLGGRKFIVLTNAKMFTGGDNYLMFSLPRGAKDKITKVKITLTPMDDYDIEFFSWNQRKLDMKKVNNFSGVYAENLQEVFTNATGLYTKL